MVYYIYCVPATCRYTIVMTSFLTVPEVAAKWKLSTARVRKLAATDRIPGAEKFGELWMIPANTRKPRPKKPGRKTGRRAKTP